MTVYVVTVDLDRLGSNYTSLRRKLLSLGAFPAQGTVWFVKYDDCADALRDNLQTHLHHNDRLFVAALSSEWASFNMASLCHWLEETRTSPAPQE